MPWTEENRPKYNRDRLRYPSDLTDEEWALIEPVIPPAKHGGRHREVNIREVVNGIMYILSTGCPWRYIPKDLPSKDTIYWYFSRWIKDGTLERIHQALYDKCRETMGRDNNPTCAAIDSQSVKSGEKGGAQIDPQGYDAGKKIKGKKRHILVDMCGFLLHVIVHPADIQDRDGGVFLLETLKDKLPLLKKIFADLGYRGPKFEQGVKKVRPDIQIEIVKRSDSEKGFKVVPHRWVVERTFAWLNRCRRLAKDWENLARHALAFIQLASIRLMVRRISNA
jgi:transposase